MILHRGLATPQGDVKVAGRRPRHAAAPAVGDHAARDHHSRWPPLLAEHVEAIDGATVFAHACKLGLEGIVSKRRDKPYRNGPSANGSS